MPFWHVCWVTERVCVPLSPQVPPKPVQFPQAPALSGPHTVPFSALPSTGQAAELPVQYSAASHAPPAERHTVVAGLLVQADVDLLGSHTWHGPAGLGALGA